MERIVNLLEDSYRPLDKGPVKNGCLVEGVKILGTKSRNGREYPIQVIQKAAHLYEGAPVNLDHPKKGQMDRQYNERFGRLANVRARADGLYGDLTFNPHHPLAESFRWWATNDPRAVGLSHNAEAKIVEGNFGNPDRVAEIFRVESVDLVADPATTTGLLESLQRVQESAPMGLNNIDEELPPPDMGGDMPPPDMGGDLGGDLAGLGGDMGGDMMGGDLGAGLPPAAPADGGGADAVAGILADPAMSADEKLAAIATAMGLPAPGGMEGLEGDMGAMPEPDGDEEAMAMKAEEALRATNDPYYHALLSKLDRMIIRESRRKTVLEAKAAAHKAKLPGYAITESLINHLASSNKASWNKIISDQRRILVRESRPRSTGPVAQNDISALVKSLTE
jgi:hypothetical protein